MLGNMDFVSCGRRDSSRDEWRDTEDIGDAEDVGTVEDAGHSDAGDAWAQGT